MKKLAIFILGMHRSGTSMLAGLFNSNGFDIGPSVMKANADNPKGFKENLAIYRLNEQILSDNGSCWDDLSTSMAEKAPGLVEKYQQDVQALIEDQFALVNRFVIKDPRNCLLLPIWSETLAGMGIEHKVVIPYRHPLEVAYSLKQRDHFPLNKGLQLYCNHLLCAEYQTRDQPRGFISYDDLLENPEQRFTQLLEELDIEIGANQTLDTSFVDNDLKHHQLSYDNISDSLPAPALELFNIVKEGRFADLSALDQIREELGTYRNFFISEEAQLTTSKQRELATLKAQVENMRGQIQERQQQINQKTNEARSFQNQLQQRNQELSQARQNNQHLQKKHDEERKQHQALKIQLAEANEHQNDVQSLKVQLNTAEKQLRLSTQKANELEEIIENERIQQQTMDKELKDREQQVNSLQQQLAALQGEKLTTAAQ